GDLVQPPGYPIPPSALDVDDSCNVNTGDCNGDGSRDVSALVLQEIETRGSSSLTSSFGTSLTYDKRNNAKNPTSGYYMQVSSDFAGAGGDVQYVRVNGEGRAYYPISDN